MLGLYEMSGKMDQDAVVTQQRKEEAAVCTIVRDHLMMKRRNRKRDRKTDRKRIREWKGKQAMNECIF